MSHPPRHRAATGTVGRTLVLAPLLALLLVACGAPGPAGTSAPHTTAAPGASSPGRPVELVSPAVGVPVDIEADGLTDVRAFTIRTDAGEQVRFLVGILENGVEFPPSHLAEHLATSSGVRVYFRMEGQDPVAYRLEDAETP